MTTGDSTPVAPQQAPGGIERRKGHRTFSALVQHENDLVGLIAYGLYKRDKLAFIERHRQKHGCEPSEADLAGYIATVNLESHLSMARDRAAELIEGMYEELLADATERLQYEHQAELVRELKAARPFWRSVGENIIANFVATLVIVALTVMIIINQQADPVTAIGRFLGLEVQRIPPAK
jgi:hypothetical protein